MASGEQTIRFAQIGPRRVAWSSVGEGPPLVMGGWWVSHLELNWEDPTFRAFVEALAEHRTVIRYDRPGTGLSAAEDPVVGDLEEEMDLLGAIAEAASEEPIELFGASSGGTVSAAFAAANPARVSRMVLYGSYTDGSEIAEQSARDSMISIVEAHWGLGSRVLSDVFLPGASAEEREEFARFQREAAPASSAVAALATVYALDVRDRLGAVQTPTLVMHRREDRALPFELGHQLAAAIPGATFVPLSGSDHFPWRGDSTEVLRRTLAFLGVEDSRLPEPESVTEPSGEEPDADLSARELEVLRLVAEGLSDPEIAERLVLSPHTVHRHVANIRTKLRLPSRAAAAAQAARMGLL